MAEEDFDFLTSDETEDEMEAEASVELDETSAKFVHELVEKILDFVDMLSDHPLFPYQRVFAYRIIESVIINDGEEITALFSRQSGKSESVANVVSALMILLPKLAHMFPDLLGKFKEGLWIGSFAPVEGQAETLFGRIVARLTSERAQEIMADSEIDDAAIGKSKKIILKNNKSRLEMMTANPRAKIESKSYHLILVDEAQDCDDYIVRKSIHPMGAFYNATIVKTGTPTTRKGDFYKAIQHNKRRQTKRGQRTNHFEADWRQCAKYNPNYKKFVQKDMLRMGEDSDEFQMSYSLKWLIERGMFTTSARMEALGDSTMNIVKGWWKSPIIVGIDPARKLDSTVVTAVWVDWDRPDEFGFFQHRVLNWLEMHGEDWEEQYFRIKDFCDNYDVMAIGVDGSGLGDVVAQRLQRLIPRSQVHSLMSTVPEQSARWKHLMQLMDRGMVSWPAHSHTKRLKSFKRFHQQMTDAEKQYQGQHILISAPDEAEAHDDYVDSLALACALTRNLTMPEVEVSGSPFMERSR